MAKIVCPACSHDKGVKRIALFTSVSYQCPKKDCTNFDQAAHDAQKRKKLKIELEIVELEKQIDPITYGPGPGYRGYGYHGSYPYGLDDSDYDSQC